MAAAKNSRNAADSIESRPDRACPCICGGPDLFLLAAVAIPSLPDSEGDARASTGGRAIARNLIGPIQVQGLHGAGEGDPVADFAAAGFQLCGRQRGNHFLVFSPHRGDEVAVELFVQAKMAEAAGRDEGDARALCPLGRSTASPRAWPSTWSSVTRLSRPRWKPFVLPKTSKEMLISSYINKQGKAAHPEFSLSRNLRESTVGVAKKFNFCHSGRSEESLFSWVRPRRDSSLRPE